MPDNVITYAQAGVNIKAGDEFINHIKEKVKSTFSESVLSNIGNFGALYSADFSDKNEPVLVSSVDGVGTKLKVAFLLNKHDTVGQDLVNHCVNDIAVIGAQPLFFMDYIAVGKLKLPVIENVFDGMVKACKENKCSLIGGETAEMPGFYRENEYDLVGMIVGLVEKKNILGEKRVKAGDVLIGVSSTGLHTNGYSLAREVLFSKYEVDDFIDDLGMSLGEALLIVHRSYLNVISKLRSMHEVHAFSHITGGGILNNTLRVIPKNLTIKIDWSSWERPNIFKLIQKCGNVPEEEMRKTFNLGIGLVIIVAQQKVDKIIQILNQQSEKYVIIGEVVKK